jgi:hypothetical protein
VGAHVGDSVIVKDPGGRDQRRAEILEIRGTDGRSPFVVRWCDDGVVGLVFPGPDAVIEHLSADCRDVGG